MRKLKCFASALLVCSISLAQDAEKKPVDLGEIHGNFQIDAQYYNPDSAIGAPVVPEKTLMNAFANLIYTRGNFSAGLRYESYLNTLLGCMQLKLWAGQKITADCDGEQNSEL